MYNPFNDSYQTKNHKPSNYGDTPQELVLRYYPEARPLNKILTHTGRILLSSRDQMNPGHPKKWECNLILNGLKHKLPNFNNALCLDGVINYVLEV